MKKKKYLKFLIIIPVIAILIFAGIKIMNKGSGKSENMLDVPVEKRDITAYVKFTGNIDSVNKKSVYTKVAGTITDVLVEKGDEVKKGDVIAKLDSSDVEFDIRIKEAAAKKIALENEYNLKDNQTTINQKKQQLETGLNVSIDTAQKQLLQAQQTYNDAVAAYNEAKALFDKGETAGVVSAQQAVKSAQAAYDAAKTQWDRMSDEERKISNLDVNSPKVALDNAKQSLELAKKNAQTDLDKKQEAMLTAENALSDAERDYNAAVLGTDQDMENAQNAASKTIALASQEEAELEIERLRSSLDKYVIYAIEDGCITELSLVEGEFTDKNKLAATITNFDKMQVLVKIDEYDIGDIAVGDEVEIFVNALGKTYKGKITNIAKTATVDNNVSYVETKVEFEADEDVISGLSAEVKIMKADRIGVLAVPVTAINYRNDDSPYVNLVDESGVPAEHDVILGVSDGSWTEVKDGLSEGDIVRKTKEYDFWEDE